MGQTCSALQQSNQLTSLNFKNINNFNNQSKSQSKRSKSYKKLIKKITFIQDLGQILYEFNSLNGESIQQKSIKKWSQFKQQVYEQVQIVQILQNSNSFIARILNKDNKIVYKLFTKTDIITSNSVDFQKFTLYYYNLLKFSSFNPKTKQQFIYPLNMYHNKYNSSSCQQRYFFIQSQQFNSPIISLKQLSIFMKQNDIYWQDKQFTQIIKKCYKIIKLQHQCKYYGFEDFLVDQEQNVLCIAKCIIIENQQQDSNKVNDMLRLVNYFIRVLYGLQEFLIEENNQLINFINKQQQKCLFKHTQSLKLINLIMLTIQNKQNDFNKSIDLQRSYKHQQQQLSYNNNIVHYISSYYAKTKLPISIQLAQCYLCLSQYNKSKQYYFQIFGTLLYDNKDYLSQNKHRHNKNKMINNKLNLNQIELCYDILQKILKLQIVLIDKDKQTSIYNQLEEISKEYLYLTFKISTYYQQNGNYLKALSILERTLNVLPEDNKSWLLYLNLAQTNLFLCNLDTAQEYFYSSIRLQLNSTNLTQFIKFYSSVLNWQKSIQLLKTYQKIIPNESIYELLISKCLLSKALCISPLLKHNQNQRKSILNEVIKIIKRIYDRKSIKVSELVMIEVLELQADCYFYLLQLNRAMKVYEDTFIRIKSYQTKTKSLNNHNNQNKNYQPRFLRQNQQNITKSFFIIQFSKQKSNSLKKNSLNKTISKNKQQSSLNNTSKNNISFYQANQLQNNDQIQQYYHQFYSYDKKSTILSSIANIYFLQQNYEKSIQIYEQAINYLSPYSIDLKNSILGNMALCEIYLGNSYEPIKNQQKIQNGKQLLKYIIEKTQQEDYSKIQNNVNYLFLKQQLNKCK